MHTVPTRSGSSSLRPTRYWNVAACLAVLAAGLLTLGAGHPLHGWLMVLGAIMLARAIAWGGPGRRRAASDVMPMLTEPPRDAGHRRPRKTA